MRTALLMIFSLFLTSCEGDHSGVSHSLKAQLASTDVSCEFLADNKYSTGYWVRSELDGWGLLVVTKDNEPNMYAIALMAHGHERAIETREIECEEL